MLDNYKELPRKPRMLASGMNWQNKFKKHLTNSKYDSISQQLIMKKLNTMMSM